MLSAVHFTGPRRALGQVRVCGVCVCVCVHVRVRVRVRVRVCVCVLSPVHEQNYL